MRNKDVMLDLVNKIRNSRSLTKTKAYADTLEMLIQREGATVILNAHNGNVIKVIKAIRGFFYTFKKADMGLKECKDITDQLPYRFQLDNVDEAIKLCNELNAAGAVALRI